MEDLYITTKKIGATCTWIWMTISNHKFTAFQVDTTFHHNKNIHAKYNNSTTHYNNIL